MKLGDDLELVAGFFRFCPGIFRFMTGAVLFALGGNGDAPLLGLSITSLFRSLTLAALLALCLQKQASTCYKLGALPAALTLHQESERVYRECGDREGLDRSVKVQGHIRSQIEASSGTDND